MQHQAKWQRITLLTVLAYEGLGAMLGGILLVAAPDGRLMNMPVDMMHGFFPNFLIPGLILLGLGILNSVAFFTVFAKSKKDWLLSGLALVGLFIWFAAEITILHQLHWLLIMWGGPVLVGISAALPLIPLSHKKLALS